MMVTKGQSIKGACETLGVSRSGYYGKKSTKKQSCSALNRELIVRLKKLRVKHPFWGYRRMTAWLNHREGYSINRKRIHRLMRENGLLVPRKRCKALRTSQRPKPRATRPNQFWGIDQTKFMLPGFGWCYLIVVLDWYTKKIVGWKVSLRARTSEWKEALDLALCEEFPWGARDRGLRLISDNGSQPTSIAFMRDTALLGIEQIFCSYDNPKGNAETERVIRTIKEELLWLNEFTSFEEAKDAIGDWISEDYNRLYIHSALGYQSPEEYRDQWEQSHAQEAVLGGC
jgi:transposase InsO family protein